MIPSQHVSLHNKFRVNGRVHILSITASNIKSCVVKLLKLLTHNYSRRQNKAAFLYDFTSILRVCYMLIQ